jgi:hypothetical protein
MPKMNHKNVVRYFSCWVEAVRPNLKAVRKAFKVAEERKKRGCKKGARFARQKSPEIDATLTEDRRFLSISEDEDKIGM